MSVPVYAGYLLLFGWIFLGEAGVPLLAPTELVLIAAGIAAAHGLASMLPVVTLALTADLLGTATLFALVRALDRGTPLSGRRARVGRWATRKARAVGGHSPTRIALARSVPLLRVPAAGAAALAQLSLARFLAAALAGGAVWVTLFAGGAYLVSMQHAR